MSQCSGRKTSKSNATRISAIDLFCGVGGLTCGLKNAGINVRLGIDIDPSCRFPYTANNKAKFLLKNIEEVEAKDLQHAFKGNSLKMMAGCAPCQTFSRYNQKADSSDKRWWLLMHFSRLIKEMKPELVTMENVPGLVQQSIFNTFVGDLETEGYEVSFQIVNCAEYGVPQRRQRLVLLASKLGPIRFLDSDEVGEQVKTVFDAIGKLPPLHAGEIHKEDTLHQCAMLSEINLRRIKASHPGGTWKDWDEDLVVDCHKKKSGETYPSVYGRMVWDEPSPTITTQFYGYGNGRFGHPEQDRAISLREGAILQSFPPNYLFVPPGEKINKTAVGKLIGNAVPVKIGEIIGKSILRHVAEQLSKNKLLAAGGDLN